MKMQSLLALLLFAFLYIIPLGARPMVTPDEGRYAEIPREMRESGNWVAPHLNGLRYFEKPAGGYWLTAASFTFLGENRFAMRLPSALAAGISALAVFLLTRRHVGGNMVPLLAASSLLTSVEPFAIGVYNVLDGPFSMFITVAMAAFFEAAHARRERDRIVFMTVFGASCGMAFLVKGFLGFVLPGAAILPFLIWERRWKDIFTMPWIPLVAALAVAMPWCIAVHRQEPDFWHYFFWVEHVQRFLSPATSAQHQAPFWYFLPVVLLGAMPWTTVFPAAVLGHLRSHGNRSLRRFAVSWVVFPFFLMSLSGGKLGTYILPCFPPLMILLATGLVEYVSGNGRRTAFVAGMRCLGILSCAVAGGLVVVQTMNIASLKYYDSGETWKWIVSVLALVYLGTLAWLSTVGRKPARQMFICCLAPVCLLMSTHFVIPNRTMDGRPPCELLPPDAPQPSPNSVLNPTKFKEGKGPESFIRKHADRIFPSTLVVSDCHTVSALCWIYRRSDIAIIGSTGELSYGLGYQDSQHRQPTLEQLCIDISRPERPYPVAIMMRNKHYPRYRVVLPAPDFEEVFGGFVLAVFDIP